MRGNRADQLAETLLVLAGRDDEALRVIDAKKADGAVLAASAGRCPSRRSVA